MAKVIRIVGNALLDRPFEGKVWLQEYDPDGLNGFGSLTFTTDPERAMRFVSAGEAMDLWRKQSTVQPLRDDGKPNRPLTAFTVTIEDAP